MNLLSKILRNTICEPKTVTVRITIPDDGHCDVTYIANDQATEHLAVTMMRMGHGLKCQMRPVTSATLLEKEIELGLKRHGSIFNGEILPAFQRHHRDGHISCEFWKRGKRADVFGVHGFETNASGEVSKNNLLSTNSDIFCMDDNNVKKNFIKSHNDMRNTALSIKSALNHTTQSYTNR